MLKKNVKNLEKVVEYYRKIEGLLDGISESIYNTGPEFYGQGNHTNSTLVDAKEMLEGAAKERYWAESKLRVFKEMIND